MEARSFPLDVSNAFGNGSQCGCISACSKTWQYVYPSWHLQRLYCLITAWSSERETQEVKCLSQLAELEMYWYTMNPAMSYQAQYQSGELQEYLRTIGGQEELDRRRPSQYTQLPCADGSTVCVVMAILDLPALSKTQTATTSHDVAVQDPTQPQSSCAVAKMESTPTSNPLEDIAPRHLQSHIHQLQSPNDQVDQSKEAKTHDH